MNGLLNCRQIIALLLFAGCLFPYAGRTQMKISPYLIGQNAWERKSVFKVKEQIAEVKFQAIRIGGNTYESINFFDQGAIDLIDFVRSAGAEPILQMPRQFKDNEQAYKAIAWLNGKMGKNIRFWSIGNEPDHRNQRASEEEVRDYFSKISEQIKRYDPKALVMGFDLSSYKLPYLNRLLGGDLDLTGKVPGKDYYYLDMVTFHNYKFRDISKFEADVKDLKSRLQQFNKKRPAGQQIGWAVTEFNSHWLVDPKLDEDYMPYNFHNGQIYAEMYDLGMREGAFTICPWSMLEGGADREGTDLSLFDLTDAKYIPRSNYYHTQLLARYSRANYLRHRQTAKNIVVIPTADQKGISVMVLNKDKNAGANYSLRFTAFSKAPKPVKATASAVSTASPVIQIEAGIDKNYDDTIPAFSTQMLMFDVKGRLIRKFIYTAKDAEGRTAPQEIVR